MKKYVLCILLGFLQVAFVNAQQQEPLDTLYARAVRLSATGEIKEATRLLLEVEKVAER